MTFKKEFNMSTTKTVKSKSKTKKKVKKEKDEFNMNDFKNSKNSFGKFMCLINKITNSKNKVAAA